MPLNIMIRGPSNTGLIYICLWCYICGGQFLLYNLIFLAFIISIMVMFWFLFDFLLACGCCGGFIFVFPVLSSCIPSCGVNPLHWFFLLTIPHHSFYHSGP